MFRRKSFREFVIQFETPQVFRYRARSTFPRSRRRRFVCWRNNQCGSCRNRCFRQNEGIRREKEFLSITSQPLAQSVPVTSSMKALWICCFSLLGCFPVPAAPGEIVLLNGTSSAGKSSLAESMIRDCKQKYEVVSFDDFYHSYLKKHGLAGFNREQYDDFLLSLYRHVKAQSEAGQNVIIDTVEFELAYDKYCEILDCSKVIKVIVYCPLDHILKRIDRRNNTGDASGRRPVLLSFQQFLQMYQRQASPEELVVERTSTGRLRAGLVEAGKKAGNPRQYAFLYQQYVKTFGIDKDQELVIVPRRKYDLVINTRASSKKENVRTLENYIRGRL